MNELALFAGTGGGILGSLLHGWRTVCAVEIEDYPRRVLLQRQADGILPRFPIWDDVCTFDGVPWRGKIDIITGGFPCQDISAAGKGAGISGERSGLWSEFARIIREVRPRFALIENSPMLTIRGLDVVLCDLAAMGYDARWGVVSAENAGAPHKRERIWIVASSDTLQNGCERNTGSLVQTERKILSRINKIQSRYEARALCTDLADSDRVQLRDLPRWGSGARGESAAESPDDGAEGWWAAEPDVGRVADGVAHRLERLSAIGNGQVPAVVRLAWETLTNTWI